MGFLSFTLQNSPNNWKDSRQVQQWTSIKKNNSRQDLSLSWLLRHLLYQFPFQFREFRVSATVDFQTWKQPLNTWDRTVQTMECQQKVPSKASENRSISQKSYNFCFFGIVKVLIMNCCGTAWKPSFRKTSAILIFHHINALLMELVFQLVRHPYLSSHLAALVYYRVLNNKKCVQKINKLKQRWIRRLLWKIKMVSLHFLTFVFKKPSYLGNMKNIHNSLY